ncbi:ricin-type beta-trefoil lectin domain protein [Streptomyces sp. NPDC006879]|uniref:RICIN domain-containing protein n=1 Tax=Streptomyces sp. NPDC006879 TaxID=3364767 RepID=UPI0036802991
MNISKRVSRPLAVATMVPALAIGAASNAFADGNVSWRNVATGKYLMVAQGTFGMVLTGSDSSARWREVKQSDGSWQLKAHRGSGNVCLDSNAAGKVYLNPCGSNNNYQKWWETKTSTGWKITNKATGRVLDSNSRQQVYTLPDNGGKNQRWS